MIPKSPSILLVGASVRSHRDISSRLRRRFEGFGAEWNPLLNSCGSFAMGLTYCYTTPSLDIVHIDNQVCMSPSDMESGCNALAKLVALHPKRPRVVVEDRALDHLTPYFLHLRVPTFTASLESVIVELLAQRSTEGRDDAA